MEEKKERRPAEETDVEKDKTEEADNVISEVPPTAVVSSECKKPADAETHDAEPAKSEDCNPDQDESITEDECVEQSPESHPVFKKLGTALDSLEAKLEKPVIPIWNRYKELGTLKKFLAAFCASLVAVCLVFLCFLPGILKTVEKNRAEEAAVLREMEEAEAKRLAAEAAEAEEQAMAYQAKAKVAEYKHDILTEFYASEYSLQLRTCSIVLSPSQLSGLYKLEETATSYHFVPDREQIKDYLTGFCEANEPDPVTVKYCNTAKTRETVYCPEYDAGFTPDIDKAAEDLALLIALGKGGTVEMEYFGSSYCESIWNKVNGTAIEISLSNQYLWLYYDGKVVVETPIVSGNLSTGDRTPSGKFFIYWITTDTYLKGATWYDYVSHWAPFYGNYGIHDAQWRTEFGGDIYMTDGSHGCINVPIDAMNEIAAYYYIKMPVVIY